MKLDANGNKLWDKTLGGSSDDYLSSLKQTYDGGYILGGTSDSGISGDKTQSSQGGEDYWVIKLDAFGNKSWDKTFGGSVRDELSSFQQTTDGGFILGGYSKSGISGDRSHTNKGIEDYWVVKLDANGNKTWDKAIGGSNESGLTCLQQTLDGGYILGGNSNSGIGGDKSQACQGAYDYWVVKLGAQAPYLPTDVAVSAITSVNSGCLSNQETITITVNNFGTTAQNNIPVSYRINNGTPVNEVVAGPLVPNASVSYSFTTKANLSASGTYNIEAKAILAGDALLSNNTFTKVVTNYAVPAIPTVSNSGTTTICTGSTVMLSAASTTSGVSYQWFNNGTAISGATTATYTANSAGSYTVTATVNGCISAASAATILTITPAPPAPGINVTSSLVVCPGDSVALIAVSSVPGATFTWFKDGNVIAGATSATYMAKTAGSYTVTATANGCASPASLARTVTITPTPAKPTITQTGFVLTSSSNTGNQWYKDNVAIAGATAQSYTTTSNGSYSVVVIDNSCPSATSNAIVISTTGIGEDLNGLNVAIYPNPSDGLFTITLPEDSSYDLTVTDLTGKVIRQLTTKDKNTHLNISNAAKGVYILKITSEDKTTMRKLLVE